MIWCFLRKPLPGQEIGYIRKVSDASRGVLIACLLLAMASLAHAESVVLIQESNGFPGGERSTQLARQQIVVDGPRLRVLDTAHMWALFIDLESQKVQESAIDQKEFVERPFSHYKKYADDRARTLKSQADEWKRLREKVEGDPKRLREAIDDYRRMGGDPQSPGKIVARLQAYPQDTKTASILVDREPTDVVLEHYVIRENQADKPIFDLWTTKTVEVPADLFRFYREIGTFSQQVTAKLLEVPGTVIECTAVLDTGTLKKTFRSRILEVRKRDRMRGSMTVPEGWKKVDPKKPATANKPADLPAKTCAVCKAVIKDRGYKFREPWGKRRIQWACSSKHRTELIKRAAAERKKTQGSRPK